MKKAIAVIAVLLLLTLALSGCSSDSSSTTSSGPASGTLISSPSFTPVNVVPQFISSADGAVAPGMANVWDLIPDFSLADGSDDQFDVILGLTVGATAFPEDQTQSELTYYTPAMGAADGTKVVSVSSDTTSWYSAITGTYSAYIYPTGNSILQQTVSLATATGTVTLGYSIDGASYGGSYDWGSYFTGAPDSFRIVVRDTTGAELEELYLLTDTSSSGTYTADLTAYSGQTIVLSFEHQGQNYPIVIDNVSVTDDAAAEFVTNGGFETGVLTPWTANTPKMYTNITSGTRTLESLDVTRSFYTVPNKLWARWVDVFSNPTGSDITTTVSYYNELGNDWSGIIYSTPGTSNKALTSWDGCASDRDVAFVFGNATTYDFTSDTDLCTDNGDDLMPTTYDITVPAGGAVAIVNFIIMGGTDTGQTALDITATADEVDAVAAAIVADFWTDAQYTAGMTQAQKDAVSNF